MNTIHIRYEALSASWVGDAVTGQEKTLKCKFIFDKNWDAYPIRYMIISREGKIFDPVLIDESNEAIVHGEALTERAHIMIGAVGLAVKNGETLRYNGRPCRIRVDQGNLIWEPSTEEEATAYEKLLVEVVDLKKTVDAVSDALAGKMDATNPVGTGSFSMGRKEGTDVGDSSHTEGKNTTASGVASHAEGYDTTASQYYAHAEGARAISSGWASHAEGQDTTASGNYSHAEGTNTTASGYASHTEGSYTTASDDDGHAEGFKTTASGKYSHSEGVETIAQGWSQHVHGKYNIPDSDDVYAHIVGNGESDTQRSNAHTLDWDGNAWYAGDVYVGSTSGTNMDESSKKLATEEYVDQKTVTDPTLTVEGAAADAKAVGDKLAEKITAPATASVGQTIKVSAVDENGKPTAWEAVDLSKSYEYLIDLTEDVESIDFDFTDSEGNPIMLDEVLIVLHIKSVNVSGCDTTLKYRLDNGTDKTTSVTNNYANAAGNWVLGSSFAKIQGKTIYSISNKNVHSDGSISYASSGTTQVGICQPINGWGDRWMYGNLKPIGITGVKIPGAMGARSQIYIYGVKV